MRIRKVEIRHFRGIEGLVWFPSEGINCLIGSGDSGKSSVLDAIDICLGARRSVQITDADFHKLDANREIVISVTIGELNDGLMNLDKYGMYLRGFDSTTGCIEDEPGNDIETVLTLRLTIGSDLDPSWSLVSERAEAQDQSRNLAWEDRVRLAPTRIGATSAYHLSWRRGSVLNRVSSERADASSLLAESARQARAEFGDVARDQLGETLSIVATTSRELGIPIGSDVKAMLDAQSVSFGGGTISLHDAEGIPLAGLGSGSIRLLVSGLQRKAAHHSSIIVIDEVEYGLEPHRIIRLLGSLGAKEANPPLQVFMATHSPVAVRELSGAQLFVIRPAEAEHEILPVGTSGDTQSAARRHPEAFLAASIIVCEGASEVGLLRGIDQHRTSSGHDSLSAMGTALVDSGGGDPDRAINLASAFIRLGYHVAVVRDADVSPTESIETRFIEAGGRVVAWRDGRALEDELFRSVTYNDVKRLIHHAVELHGDKLVDDHIKSKSNGTKDLQSILSDLETGKNETKNRRLLGKASRSKKAGWYKTVTWMEAIGREIVAPELASSDPCFRSRVNEIFEWAKVMECQNRSAKD